MELCRRKTDTVQSKKKKGANNTWASLSNGDIDAATIYRMIEVKTEKGRSMYKNCRRNRRSARGGINDSWLEMKNAKLKLGYADKITM